MRPTIPHSLDGLDGVLSNELCGFGPRSGHAPEAKLMSHLARLIACLFPFVVDAAAAEPAGEPLYPAKVSENGRYFVDQKGQPVFWLGTTQWQLFREYSLEDARTIIEKSKEKGFVFAQVMLMGVGDGTKPNIHGAKPWIDNNPLTPNEAYFQNVDAVLRTAREHNFNISMTLYHQRYRKFITQANARAWAKWLAKRYKNVPTIVWSMTPEAKPEFVPLLRELAAGLHEGDGGAHLITFKPDPRPIPPALSTARAGSTSIRCRRGSRSS